MRRSITNLFLLIYCIFIALFCAADETLRVTFINVGYADAIFIQTPQEKNILIDAGEQPVQQRLVRFLAEQQIKALDLLLITHEDTNHINQKTELTEVYSVKNTLVNPVAGEIIYQEKDLTLKTLHPKNKTGSPNADSTATLLSYRDNSIFLTADILNEQLEEVVKNYPEVSKVQIVQIAHHGDFLHPHFLNNQNKYWFIASVGKNIWGAPDEELLAALPKDRLYRTDQHGNIQLISNGKKWLIQAEK